MEKLKIKQAVLVEGKYDKVTLDAVIDATIIPVHGFSLFTDGELQSLIKILGEAQGLVVLTDSDMAGFKIRGFIRGLVPKDQLTELYIPDILGKEKRKTTYSKEGTLGVEGIDKKLLRGLFVDAGLVAEGVPKASEPITANDFILLGLSGGEGSSQRRQKLFKALGLPSRLSTKAVISVVNNTMTRDRFLEIVKEL